MPSGKPRVGGESKRETVQSLNAELALGVALPIRHAVGLTGIFWALFLAGLCVCGAQEPSVAADAGQLVYQIKPSETDSAIRRFDDPHYVVVGSDVGADAQLVVFMPGTGGKPAGALPLLRVIASQGYRVVGLEYNDSPAVIQVCPKNPSAACSGDFRRKRIFGDDVTAIVDNTPAESIVNRLVRLMEYLDSHHPGEGWRRYLMGDRPYWSRVVVSGLSQGAGMAAYIAKNELVARVVLFSSPWDYSLSSKALAPWIGGPSVTPLDRWFAEYHRREETAGLIAQAYAVLRIPAANIQVFDLDLPSDLHVGNRKNPYHGSTIRLPGYEPQWRLLYGKSPSE